jgi:hypothetical protein
VMTPLGPRATVFVNASVTVAPVPMMRLAAAMVMDTSIGTEMPPLGAPADGTASVSVCTVMPVVEPAVAVPMVNPESVMVTAVPAEMVAPDVVITIEAVVVAAGARDRDPTFAPLAAKVGVTPDVKNPEG